jgi:hypothetical protein
VTKGVHRTWYRVALARTGGPVQVVAASGEHMGQAIAEARDHIDGSWPVAVDNATAEHIPLGESVGKGHVLMLDVPTAQTAQTAQTASISTFRWPSGVLPALSASASFAGAGSGWVTHADPALLVMEAQTDAEHLVDLFMGLVERLPAGDNLEVRLLDHFEDAGTTDVWLTSRVNVKKILRFLDDYDTELIANGHVELAVYVRSHKATLKLTEHKTVVWVAEDRALEADVTGWLRELSVPRVEALVTARAGAHFHYRPAKTRDRKKLSDELYKHRLRKVDSVKRATGSG